jgi:hypothetical protein
MAITVVFFDLGETLVTTPRQWLPGAKVLLNSLRQKGFRLGIISNTPGLTTRSEIYNLLPTDFDPAAFEAILTHFLSEVGKEKPQKATRSSRQASCIISGGGSGSTRRPSVSQVRKYCRCRGSG